MYSLYSLGRGTFHHFVWTHWDYNSNAINSREKKTSKLTTWIIKSIFFFLFVFEFILFVELWTMFWHRKLRFNCFYKAKMRSIENGYHINLYDLSLIRRNGTRRAIESRCEQTARCETRNTTRRQLRSIWWLRRKRQRPRRRRKSTRRNYNRKQREKWVDNFYGVKWQAHISLLLMS